jgi:hypothetical protein
MDDTLLTFQTHIGKQKPETIRNRENPCPFCQPQITEQLIEQDGPILWVENKYPVLKDTYQTVLIETDQCDSELSLYGKAHLHRLFRFGIRRWLDMEQSGEYRSVIYLKNHGPLSGGTIAHPHSQIIGLKHVDCMQQVRPEHFMGVQIDSWQGMEFNVSTHPRSGFVELNASAPAGEEPAWTGLADYVQIAAHFVLNHYHAACTSYNLFFYHIDDRIWVKIIPRFVTSPMYIGYSIAQVADHVMEIAGKVRELYFHEGSDWMTRRETADV